MQTQMLVDFQPAPHSNRTRGYLCSVPITGTPLSHPGKSIYPLSLLYMYVTIGKSSRDYSQKIPPIPEKIVYACGPSCIHLMHSSGGGGGGGGAA